MQRYNSITRISRLFFLSEIQNSFSNMYEVQYQKHANEPNTSNNLTDYLNVLNTKDIPVYFYLFFYDFDTNTSDLFSKNLESLLNNKLYIHNVLKLICLYVYTINQEYLPKSLYAFILEFKKT
ncbi:hypothetical protein COBT_003247, partial [Conglomerata obtusa]